MDPELKAKWIEALESGEYVHGKASLCIQTSQGYDEFCCLGVLADIIDPDGWDEEIFRGHSLDAYANKFGGMSKRSLLDLTEINDALLTRDFTQQIIYIKENL